MQNKQDLDLSICSNSGGVFSFCRSASGGLIRPTDKKTKNEQNELKMNYQNNTNRFFRY